MVSCPEVMAPKVPVGGAKLTCKTTELFAGIVTGTDSCKLRGATIEPAPPLICPVALNPLMTTGVPLEFVTVTAVTLGVVPALMVGIAMGLGFTPKALV